ncbi:DegT/DnrJ/EryC1/StrS family aminotransferase [Staphylococcus kloosii]|uniref:DegT/DnrJ/EryC1/StrS family aminotransferase n=1 Tax=Staphylococcus kloosii TaxID=29384 RepID=UPI00189F5A2D|nr:DegT/DnrJ/EryC1/StrS family aminotransferase [Staphylococcus kloosii]MBF7025316.1 DegT/DnrJ/EryC1/StrS family aminotransferase [Staphylococcus kloosii]
MVLKSKTLFKFRNNISEIAKYENIHANKYLMQYAKSNKVNIEGYYSEKVNKVDFLPIDKLITSNEIEDILYELKHLLPTGEFTSGQYIKIFEEYLAEYLNIKHVIALSSGTAALSIGLLSLGIGQGDEVILPANSFAATENSVSAIGAIPIYADIKEDFTICETSIENLITSKTKAILPVHLYGRFCDMKEIKKIAIKYNLNIIEDACQGIGLEDIGVHSDLAALSFNPYKNLGVCGKAGAIITNKNDLASKCRIISYHGFKLNEKNKKVLDFGFNSMIDNTQALIGKIRLERLTYNNYRRIKLAEFYDKNLSNTEGIVLPPFDDQTVWHLYPIRIKNNKRDIVKNKLKDLGVQCEIYYPYLSHEQLSYKNKISLPNTERLHKEILCLPIYPELTIDEQKLVINSLIEVMEALK